MVRYLWYDTTWHGTIWRGMVWRVLVHHHWLLVWMLSRSGINQHWAAPQIKMDRQPVLSFESEEVGGGRKFTERKLDQYRQLMIWEDNLISFMVGFTVKVWHIATPDVTTISTPLPISECAEPLYSPHYFPISSLTPTVHFILYTEDKFNYCETYD